MKSGDLRHAGCSDVMVSAKLNGRNFLVTGRWSRKLNACLVCEAQTPAGLDCFAAIQLLRPVSSMGRNLQFVDGESGRRVVRSAVHRTIERSLSQPRMKVGFRGIADSRPARRPTSGIGNSRLSAAKAERQHPVFAVGRPCARTSPRNRFCRTPPNQPYQPDLDR